MPVSRSSNLRLVEIFGRKKSQLGELALSWVRSAESRA